MGILFQIDGKLSTSAELLPKSGEIVPFNSAMLARGAAPAGAVTSFTPIGIGDPLTIDIRGIYLGQEPQTDGWSWGKQDMLVTSAVKGSHAYDGSPRAINYLSPNVSKLQSFSNIPAAADGTFIVYHTEALATYTTTATIELTFDDGFEEIKGLLSSLFAKSAKVPLFSPAAPYLIAGGKLVDEVGGLIKLLRRRSAVSMTEELFFGIAGRQDTRSGFRVLI